MKIHKTFKNWEFGHKCWTSWRVGKEGQRVWQHLMIGARRENQYIPLTLTQGNLIYYKNRNRVFINFLSLSREKYLTFQSLAHLHFHDFFFLLKRCLLEARAQGRRAQKASAGKCFSPEVDPLFRKMGGPMGDQPVAPKGKEI